MATTFNLQNFLSQNREFVIEKYEELKNEPSFSGISLKEFMMRIMRNLSLNAKSQKTAESKFRSILCNIYEEETEIEVIRDRDQELKSKYQNTVFAQNLAL
ncbi:hypothetical protein HHL23_09620 [Chryseobacterium sp. RP-3-3]|uniref:Uncharacterized protein n=1 Tax=Chryseobacterium antibioticum TaxID=2728847 RepID=A0A7Y0AMJ5_9FLAO|nr:hypothetical protein [Chryseobacterium antibioticum]NML70059.1 hypothetical protein [Chryseobacterium antibioticum]